MTTYGFSRELAPRRKIDTPVSEVMDTLLDDNHEFWSLNKRFLFAITRRETFQ